MTEELPEGWTQARVEDLFCSFSGGTPSKSKKAYWGGEIPWLSSGDIKAERICAGSEFITQAGLDNSSSRLCQPGSVLIVVRSGVLKHKLPVSVLMREAAINQDIKCFDSGRDDLNSWLALALRAFSKDILALNREGTTVQSVKYDTLRNFQLPIPPPNEQGRIAKALEKLLSEVERNKERMAKIPVLLKRFRQSVIAAACSGRLTAHWREEHLTSSGDNEELPTGWRSAQIGEVIENLKYGTSQKCAYEKHGVPVLRIPNIAEGVIDHSDLKYADLPKRERQQLSLEPGDLLLIRSNGSVSLVGKTALVREDERGFAYAGYLIRLRPKRCEVLPEYLNLALASYEVRSQIELGARSTSGVNNINSEEVSALRFALPPLDEQAEIIARSQSSLTMADRIESRYKVAKTRINSLTQSILAKAFRGELVPTEAELAEQEGRSYESAEQLLDRIQSARSEVKPTSKKGKANRQRIPKRRGEPGYSHVTV